MRLKISLGYGPKYLDFCWPTNLMLEKQNLFNSSQIRQHVLSDEHTGHVFIQEGDDGERKACYSLLEEVLVIA